MRDHVSFLGTKNDGSILGLFSDRYHIYVFYEDYEDKTYYWFMLDKTYMIESVSEISFPPDIDKEQFSFIRWITPTQTNQHTYLYKGFCLVDGIECRFTIDELCHLTVTESPHKEKLLPGTYNCLTNIQVDTFTQSGNDIYLSGWDNQFNEQVYCKVDAANDVCVKRYHLSSDDGDVTVKTIAIDTYEQRVYLGGSVIRYDDNDQFVSAIPFFEVFLK